MNNAILLGAGSSVAAGFPSTRELTDRALSGEGVKRHNNTSYFISGTEPPSGTALIANCMARRLYGKAERYYSEHVGRRANHEDLFYLAKQASDDLSGEMENPAVRPFVNELRTDMSSILEACRVAALESMRAHEPTTDPRLFFEAVDNPHCRNLKDLMNETSNYIADIVWGSLCYQPESERLSQLNLLVHACKNVAVTSISTLCHDTHVEKFLIKQGISLSDGFSEPQNDVRYWIGDFASGIPFIKLHGSVNWFRLRPDEDGDYRDNWYEGDGGGGGNDWYDDRIGIPLTGDHWHTRTDNNILQTPPDERPLLLIGTFNKITTYSSGIFRELHYHFRSSISKADQIIICGYGFADKGINAEITGWYYKKRGRRLVIIHPDPDSLAANARGAIRDKWSGWKDNGSLEFISKRLEDVCPDEFAAVIAQNR